MEHPSNAEFLNCVKAVDLMAKVPTFFPKTTCAEAFQWFQANDEYHSVAIIDEQEFVHGLVNRLAFLAQYARPYFPEICGKKSILKFADTNPITVDEFVDAARLGGFAIGRELHRPNGEFVVGL